MEVLKYNKNLKLPDKKRYVALGIFDGVHQGHQKLIKEMVKKARQNNGLSLVVTFEPHPDKIIPCANHKVFLLTLQNEKIKIIQNLGVDVLLIINFTKTFSKISPEDFVHKILVNSLRVNELFVGFNFKFGYHGDGDVNYLKEKGKENNFKTTIIDPVTFEDNIISSTKIKEFILKGDIPRAKKFLGYNLIFNGKVIHGRGRGKNILNIATANIKLPREKIIPANGVYIVLVNIKDKKYYGLMNIGIRPTFNEVKRTIEIHLLDFDQDIYHQDISFIIIKKIREEQYFNQIELLKKQIEQDINYIRKIILKK